jgi:hypothetical protein
MLSFDDELEKVGAPIGGVLQRLGQRALSGGSAAALAGTAGAGLGGLAGGVRGYQQAKEQGGSGLAGALTGGVRGMALGGGLGAVGGGVGGMLAGKHGIQAASQMAKRTGPLGAISRFGQRQVHSLTGALPGGFKSRSAAIRSIGAGGADIQKQLGETGKSLRTAKGPDRKKLTAQRESLRKAEQHARTSEELGMTTIPGFFRTMASRDAGKGLKASLGQQWHGSPSVGGKFVTVGLPAGFVAAEAARPSTEGGPGRVSRTAKSFADIAPHTLTAMPMAGATALGIGLSAGGKAIGRLLRSKRAAEPAPYPEEAEGMSTPVERIESPAVQGKLPEGFGG